MTTLSTRAKIGRRQPTPRNLLPLAAGIFVSIAAAVLNHFIFLRNIPDLALGAYEPTAIIRDGGAAVDLAIEPRGMGEMLFDDTANLVASLDGRAAEIMGLIRGRVAPGKVTEDEIAVIAVDEASLSRIGSWPWSRRDLARIVGKFKTAKAVGFDLLFYEPDRVSLKNYLSYFQAIYGFDASSHTGEIDPELLDNDLFFGKTISSVETVLGIFFFSDPVVDGSYARVVGSFTVEARLPDGSPVAMDEVVFREADDVMVNLDALRTNGRGPRGEGFMNLMPNASRAVRSVPLFIRQTGGAARDAGAEEIKTAFVYPSLPLEMVRLGLGADRYVIDLFGEKWKVKGLESAEDEGLRYSMKSVSLLRGGENGDEVLLTIPVDELGDMMVSVLPRSRSFRVYPAWEVLAGLHENGFEGKYVLFDVTASGIGNVKGPLLAASSIPAVYVHANMVSAMLRQDFTSYTYKFDYYWQMFFIILAGVAISLGFFYGNYLTSFLAFLGVLLFLTAGNFLILLHSHTVAGLTMPVLSTMASLFAQFLMNYLVMGRDRRFIRDAFSLNVSPSILTFLENNPDKMSSLTGENRNMTVLFSDIRGFTAISEQMTAPDLARFLNEYLTPMSDVVMQNLGTVDKFMGDAIMAFWNAPTDDPNHARNAARCALQMRETLDTLQPGWSERGLPELAIGCGINSGPMFAGYMGSEQRKNYTVMGDNVNIASRLEGLTKVYNVGIVISQFTRVALGPSFFCRVLDKVRVSGRHEPIVIYELLAEGIQDEARYEEIASFERVFTLYQEREFKAAEALLQEIIFITPNPLYDMYMDRLAVYNALPPPMNWDGVFTVTRG